MQRDARSNREQETVPLTVGATGSGTATVTPRRRRRRGLNPWYFVLIGGLPLLTLAAMLFPLAGQWPPRDHSILPTPTAVWDQVARLEVAEGTVAPAPDLGSGWYIVRTEVANNSDHDLQQINVRAFFYNAAGALIGSGVADLIALKRGTRQPVEILAQLTNGPIPKAGTPTPGPPTGYDHYEVKVIAVQLVPTPTR